jgi:hypothetical protein
MNKPLETLGNLRSTIPGHPIPRERDSADAGTLLSAVSVRQQVEKSADKQSTPGKNQTPRRHRSGRGPDKRPRHMPTVAEVARRQATRQPGQQPAASAAKPAPTISATTGGHRTAEAIGAVTNLNRRASARRHVPTMPLPGRPGRLLLDSMPHLSAATLGKQPAFPAEARRSNERIEAEQSAAFGDRASALAALSHLGDE